MKEITESYKKQVEEQAAHWLIILERAELTAEEQQNFEQWYNTSRFHQETLVAMSELWKGLGQ